MERTTLHLAALFAFLIQFNILAQDNASPSFSIDNKTEFLNEWVYPVSWAKLPPNTDFNLLRVRTTSIETLHINTSFTTVVVPTEYASFEDVVEWYSEKIKREDLWKSYEAFRVRHRDSKKLQLETAIVDPSSVEPVIQFGTGPNYGLIKILHVREEEQVISISLLSTESETSIDIIKQLDKE